MFTYVDGELVRRNSPRKRYAVHTRSEYLCTVIEGKTYKTHRLVYLYHYGTMPHQVDHVDGNKYNTTGFKGIVWEPSRKKWRTRVCLRGKTVFSARFDDIELAEIVATMAREKYHGVFANHGTYSKAGV